MIGMAVPTRYVFIALPSRTHSSWHFRAVRFGGLVQAENVTDARIISTRMKLGDFVPISNFVVLLRRLTPARSAAPNRLTVSSGAGAPVARLYHGPI
jgi:hypothetical protein